MNKNIIYLARGTGKSELALYKMWLCLVYMNGLIDDIITNTRAADVVRKLRKENYETVYPIHRRRA